MHSTMRLYAKKKIPSPWNVSPTDPWSVFRSIRSSESPRSQVTGPTRESILESVVSEQKPDREYEVFYSSAVIGSCLIIFILIAALVFIKKRKSKHDDKSVIVFPSNQGNTSQFLTKEIHFSLPPLRSSSMGNLNEPSVEDSDIDTECLLLPTAHNQRSNSFSCYGLGVIEPALYKSTLDLDEIQWPEGHIGRLWFSLRYEPSTEKLLVSLLKAKNLPSRTVGTVNSCDPFVRLHLLPDERRYLQSKQKKKTCNPYFDETLVFQVSSKEMSERILKLTAIDSGRTKRRCEIGHITYPLKDLDIGDGTEQQLFKMDLEKEPQEIKSDLGELLLSLVYNENLNRLSVTVIEARRLKQSAVVYEVQENKRCLMKYVSSNSLIIILSTQIFQGDKHEAYVRVTLNQHYRSVKEKRTGIVRPSRDGEFSFIEGFNFKLNPTQVDVSSLAFHVFQATSGYGRDKLIGKCVLGSYMFARGKALIQWNSAIANPMEQKQDWHTLCE